MVGRKPKPTHMKLLEGNPGKRAINKKEPKPKAAIPPCPKFLSAGAKKEWRWLSKVLFQLGLLTVVDRAALAAYCQSYARWTEAEAELQKADFQYVLTSDSGRHYPNPWIAIARDAERQMKGYLSEFGLTPAGRNRLAVAEPEEKDPYGEFLERRKAG